MCQKILTPSRVNFLLLRLGQVTHLWFGFGKFPIFFPLIKKNLIGSGQTYPDQRRVGLLFTAGQKYAWVGSSQGLSLILTLLPQ